MKSFALFFLVVLALAFCACDLLAACGGRSIASRRAARVEARRSTTTLLLRPLALLRIY